MFAKIVALNLEIFETKSKAVSYLDYFYSSIVHTKVPHSRKR
jgi:hypothetical protein